MSKPLEFSIKAGPRFRRLCPVVIRTQEPVTGSWRLVDVENRRMIPAQPMSGQPAVTAILDTMQPDQIRKFRLEPGDVGGRAPGVELIETAGERVDIKIGGELFTSYHVADRWARPFLYPVVGPYGSRVTRGYPVEEIPGECKDHPHHKSIWVAHGEVNGVDNWSEEKNHGWQVHQNFSVLESGSVFGRIVEHLLWMNHEKTETQLQEEREICFYALPDEMRMIDFAIKFTTSDKAVLFGDTKEAGILSVRVATSMDGSDRGKIETGTGAIGERESWGRKAPWCDYSGPVATPWGELWSGIAIFDHPENLRYPTNWHVRDYGLMTANCFGLHDYFGTKEKPGDFMLSSGEVLTFRYRLYIHPGDARTGQVSDKFNDYINPPEIG